MYGEMFVEANNLEEAIKKAVEDEPLPKSEGYLEDSFRLDKFSIAQSYPEEAETLSQETLAILE
jgi:hypothetical protein